MQSVIEARAEQTNAAVGESTPWHFYTGKRTPAEVRTGRVFGQFYADLVRRMRPYNVIEFGAAFGVSGMYWTAALEAEHRGQLHSFEVNPDWAAIAEQNMAAVGTRFQMTIGAFEEHAQSVNGVDIAFIDAVHTREWVMPQFDLVASRCRSGAIILLDDIDFSEDMRSCWRELALDPRVVGSVALSDHLGVVELR
jgi:predicted O-methyltransferase YrrM